MADAETKLRSDRDGAEMLDAALAKVHGERTSPDPKRARLDGAKGGRAKAENAKAGRMPEAQAEKIWRRKDGLNNAQKLALMWGWSESSAYKHLKASGRPCGNPGKISE